MMLGTKAILTPQYQFVQTAILGGAPQKNGLPTVNPNPWVNIKDGFARVLPLGGAACYPVLVETELGDERLIFDSTPVYFGANRIRVKPQTMARAFGYGAVGRIAAAVGVGALGDDDITQALYPKPQFTDANGNPIPVPAGSISGSAGYLSGLFAVESGKELGAAPGLIPAFSWVANAGVFLGTTSPHNQPSGGDLPVLLPDFLRNLPAGAGPAFLGCGEGVVRHSFAPGGPGVGWANAHTLYKFYIDPISNWWVAGGSLQIGPGNTPGAVVEIEETINNSLPTWLMLVLDAADPSGNVPWTCTVTRGAR